MTRLGMQKILLASFSVGLLYLVRGGFLPYFFPIYQAVQHYSYTQIALLINIFIFAQAMFSPFTGWLIDKLQALSLTIYSVFAYLLGFILLLYFHSYPLNILSSLFLGMALITLKNVFCVAVIQAAEVEYLRRAVSIRTMMMNVGSFIGNLSAFYVIAFFGAKLNIYFLIGILILIGLLNIRFKSSENIGIKKNASFKNYLLICKNKAFLLDGIKIFAVIMPDGCWGTIIPKYMTDLYHSNHPVPVMYAASLLVFLVCSYGANSFLSRWYDQKYYLGLCRLLSFGFFIFGMWLFMFASSLIMLIFAVIVFIMGEVVIAPCYDEVTKKYANDNIGAGSYFGVLGLFDGLARVAGSAIAFTLYGYLRHTTYSHYFWLILTMIFMMIVFVTYFSVGHRLFKPPLTTPLRRE